MKKLKGVGTLGILCVITLLIPGLLGQEATAAWEMDTDRPGMDYKSFWIDKDTETFVAVKQCEDACKNDPQCRAFTYVKPGVQGVHGRCYLKNGVPAPVENRPCCISGVVRPETDEDRCKNYAAMAVQHNQSNIDCQCGYTGPRWSMDYQAHYEWCMKVPQSSADFETAERKKMLSECWEPSTSGDLSAYDWCYTIDKELGKIAFYPVIRNEGQNDWKSAKEGYYKIGVWGPSAIIEKKYTLDSFPHWYLKQNEKSILEGLTLPYHPENLYGIENIWVMSHPEDTNQGNDSNPGLSGFYKGASWETNPELVINMCKYCEAKEFMELLAGVEPVIGKRDVLAILWDPDRPAHPAPSKSVIENAIFGPKPSVKDYFFENSGGLFKLENAGVLGWYAADKPAGHYWNHPTTACKEGFIKGHVEKWAEAIRKVEKEFDFKKYDLNNDNLLSAKELTVLIVIPQNDPFGTQRAVVGREHPNKEPLIVDGVRIDVIVEAYIGSPPSVGLVAHELSHIILEAGDMYFGFFQPYAAGPYSLMDQAPNNPGHLDPFHKLKLGWLVPKVITASGWYEIPSIETSHEAYILYDPKRSNKEYYIIENRWPGTSYDTNLPSSGLAIWHIIEDEATAANLSVPTGVDPLQWNDPRWTSWTRRGIRMIRPTYGPPIDWSLWDGSNPQTGYDLLSFDPNPNHVTLKWADGTPSGFAIRSIPPPSALMKVKIEVK